MSFVVRFTITLTIGLAERFGVKHSSLQLTPRYNIGPSQPVPVVVRSEEGGRELAEMVWGLVPHWARDPAAAGHAVMSQNGDPWEVSKIPVLISSQTELGSQPIVVGNAVRVKGYTQLGGTVMAERVDLLPKGMPLPDVDDDHAPAAGQEKPEAEQQQDSGDDNSNEGSDDGAPKPEATKAPREESTPRAFSRSGVVNWVDGSTLVVNGQSMNISNAKIEGTPKVGATVKVEGYFDANGIFVVTKIEVENGGSENGGSASDDGSKDSSNDNGSHEDSNDNDNNNSNTNEDDNSNSGGSSGSGGGGGDD